MALNMAGEIHLPADRGTVWERINDPEVLRACIPGCQSLEKTADDAFAASVKIKVGPIGATFKGSVTLTEIDAPNGYRISGSGEGGIAGFAKGGARISLSDGAEGGCLLTYEAEANVGGKIAQLGARMIDSFAKKTADQFFANLAREVARDPS